MRWQKAQPSIVMVTPDEVIVVTLFIAVVTFLLKIVAGLAAGASALPAEAYTLQARSGQEHFYPVDLKKHSCVLHIIINSGA